VGGGSDADAGAVNGAKPVGAAVGEVVGVDVTEDAAANGGESVTSIGTAAAITSDAAKADHSVG
jgi:hypothetical protein